MDKSVSEGTRFDAEPGGCAADSDALEFGNDRRRKAVCERCVTERFICRHSFGDGNFSLNINRKNVIEITHIELRTFKLFPSTEEVACPLAKPYRPLCGPDLRL